MAPIRVKMVHFTPGNAVNHAKGNYFQPCLIIGRPWPITLVFAPGRNRSIKAHGRLLFPVPHKAGFCPPYLSMIPTVVQPPEVPKRRRFRGLSKKEMAGFYVNRCHPSKALAPHLYIHFRCEVDC
jgi:hypothetical protein